MSKLTQKILGIRTRADWANAVLGEGGWPDTKTNVDNLVGWATAEGGAGPQFGVANNDDSYNPLNTTLGEPGSVTTNSAGVQSFTSWAEGLDATVATLENGDYSGILDALSNSADWQTFAAAVDASPWGTTLGPTDVYGTGTIEPSSYSQGQSQGDSTSTGVQGVVNTPGTQGTPQTGKGNKPSTSLNPKDLTGFAGVLQEINQWYNPATPGTWQSITSLGSADVKYVAILIFVRATSAMLFAGVTTIGVLTLLRGGSSGSGGLVGGTTNVLEFVNQQQGRNLARARFGEQQQEHERVETRSQRTTTTRRRAIRLGERQQTHREQTYPHEYGLRRERVRQQAAAHNLNVEKEVRRRQGKK